MLMHFLFKRFIILSILVVGFFSLNSNIQAQCPVPAYSAALWATYGIGTNVSQGGIIYTCIDLTGRWVAPPSAAWSAIADPCAAAPPSGFTNSASSIGCLSATLNGSISTGPVTERGFVWSTSNVNPTIADTKIIVGSGTGAYTNNFTGLTMGVTYYARAYGTNASGTAYGTAFSFITLTTCTAPALTTGATSGALCTNITLNGNVTSSGGEVLSAKGFIYSTTAADLNTFPATGSAVTSVNGSTAIGAYSNALTGLVADGVTTYYYKAYATNALGTTLGAVQSFTLPVCADPQITSVSFASTSCTVPIAYNLNGNLVSPGGYTVAERGFVYATTPNPTTANTKLVAGGTGTGAYTVSASGLTAATTYYARAYVLTTAGTVFYGSQLSFSACSKKWVSRSGSTTFDYYLGGVYQGTVAQATIPTTIAAGDSLVIEHNNCSFGNTDINATSTACTPNFDPTYNDPAWMQAANCTRFNLANIFGTVIVRSGGFMVNGTGMEVKSGGRLLVDGSGSANLTRLVSWGAVFNYGETRMLNNGRMDLNGSLNSSAGAIVTTAGIFKCCGSLQNYAPSCYNGSCLDQVISCADVLPVTWVSVSALISSGGNQVKWTTAREENNAYFVVWRSIDGKTWTSIGQAEGVGNSSGLINYQYFDFYKGAAYYRIQQVDKDGTSSYSPIARTSQGLELSAAVVSVNPNPGNGLFAVSISESVEGTYTVSDASGRQVASGSFELGSFSIDLRDAAYGMYVLSFPGQALPAQRLIVQP
jgi:hypothetical protein